MTGRRNAGNHLAPTPVASERVSLRMDDKEIIKTGGGCPAEEIDAEWRKAKPCVENIGRRGQLIRTKAIPNQEQLSGAVTCPTLPTQHCR